MAVNKKFSLHEFESAINSQKSLNKTTEYIESSKKQLNDVFTENFNKSDTPKLKRIRDILIDKEKGFSNRVSESIQENPQFLDSTTLAKQIQSLIPQDKSEDTESTTKKKAQNPNTKRMIEAIYDKPNNAQFNKIINHIGDQGYSPQDIVTGIETIKLPIDHVFLDQDEEKITKHTLFLGGLLGDIESRYSTIEEDAIEVIGNMKQKLIQDYIPYIAGLIYTRRYIAKIDAIVLAIEDRSDTAVENNNKADGLSPNNNLQADNNAGNINNNPINIYTSPVGGYVSQLQNPNNATEHSTVINRIEEHYSKQQEDLEKKFRSLSEELKQIYTEQFTTIKEDIEKAKKESIREITQKFDEKTEEMKKQLEEAEEKYLKSIKKLKEKTNKKIETLDNDMRQEFTKVNKELDDTKQLLEEYKNSQKENEKKITELEQVIGELEKRVKQLEDMVQKLQKQIDDYTQGKKGPKDENDQIDNDGNENDDEQSDDTKTNNGSKVDITAHIMDKESLVKKSIEQDVLEEYQHTYAKARLPKRMAMYTYARFMQNRRINNRINTARSNNEIIESDIKRQQRVSSSIGNFAYEYDLGVDAGKVEKTALASNDQVNSIANDYINGTLSRDETVKKFNEFFSSNADYQTGMTGTDIMEQLDDIAFMAKIDKYVVPPRNYREIQKEIRDFYTKHPTAKLQNIHINNPHVTSQAEMDRICDHVLAYKSKTAVASLNGITANVKLYKIEKDTVDLTQSRLREQNKTRRDTVLAGFNAGTFGLAGSTRGRVALKVMLGGGLAAGGVGTLGVVGGVAGMAAALQWMKTYRDYLTEAQKTHEDAMTMGTKELDKRIKELEGQIKKHNGFQKTLATLWGFGGHSIKTKQLNILKAVNDKMHKTGTIKPALTLIQEMQHSNRNIQSAAIADTLARLKMGRELDTNFISGTNRGLTEQERKDLLIQLREAGAQWATKTGYGHLVPERNASAEKWRDFWEELLAIPQNGIGTLYEKKCADLKKNFQAMKDAINAGRKKMARRDARTNLTTSATVIGTAAGVSAIATGMGRNAGSSGSEFQGPHNEYGLGTYDASSATDKAAGRDANLQDGDVVKFQGEAAVDAVSASSASFGDIAESVDTVNALAIQHFDATTQAAVHDALTKELAKVQTEAVAAGADAGNVVLTQQRWISGIEKMLNDLVASGKTGVTIEEITFDPASFKDIDIQASVAPGSGTSMQDIVDRSVAFKATIDGVPGHWSRGEPLWVVWPGFSNTYAKAGDQSKHDDSWSKKKINKDREDDGVDYTDASVNIDNDKHNKIVNSISNKQAKDKISKESAYITLFGNTDLLSQLEKQIPSMHPDCKLSINLPAYKEGANIYKCLYEYSVKQMDKAGNPINSDLYEINVFLNSPNKSVPLDAATEDEVMRFKKDYPNIRVNLIKHQFDFTNKPKMGAIYKTVADLSLFRKIHRSKNKNMPIIIRNGGADAKEKNKFFLNSIIQSFDDENVAIYKSESRYPKEVLEQLPLLHIVYTLNSGLNRLFVKGESNIGSGSYRSDIYASIGGFNPALDLREDIDLSKRMSKYVRENGLNIRKTLQKNALDDPRRAIWALYKGYPINNQYKNYNTEKTNSELAYLKSLPLDQIAKHPNISLTKKNLEHHLSELYKSYLTRVQQYSKTIAQYKKEGNRSTAEVKDKVYEVTNRLFSRMFMAMGWPKEAYRFVRRTTTSNLPSDARIEIKDFSIIEKNISNRSFNWYNDFK